MQCGLWPSAGHAFPGLAPAKREACTLRRWLGWDSNMQAAVALYAKLIRGAEGAGPGLVRGLATDIANYTPREKF